MALHFLSWVADLYVDNLLPVLHGSCQLRVNALADEDYLDQSKVSQVGPTYSSENVEFFTLVIGHVSKWKPVSFCLSF